MASLGLLESLASGAEERTKRVLLELMRALVPNLRFGPVEHQTKAENFQAYYVSSTTGASTGEFSVEHGIGRTPYLVLPVLDVTAVGAQMVPLEVTRAADERRLYFKSTSTSAPFSVYVEG